MSWTDLLAARRVQRHTASRPELDSIRRVIERDLQDAQLPQLSPDRRFATAYSAALQAAKMAIAATGYRVIGPGHHQTTFEALELAMGKDVESFAQYFDTCRRKRNILDYDAAEVASDTEAEELLRSAQTFRERVERWIAEHHPALTM